MNRIYPLLLSLLFITSAFGSEQQATAKPQDTPEVQTESIKEKPYILEVAYGDKKRSSSDESFETRMEVDPGILSSATILSIAVSPNESGEVIDKGRHTVKYLVSENLDGSFDLKIDLRTLEGGLRSINAEITLRPSDWYVTSGFTRPADNGTLQTYVAAIRIEPRAIQAR
jgi:hypothetical protein